MESNGAIAQLTQEQKKTIIEDGIHNVYVLINHLATIMAHERDRDISYAIMHLEDTIFRLDKYGQQAFALPTQEPSKIVKVN